MQADRYAGVQVCTYASGQVCRSPGVEAWISHVRRCDCALCAMCVVCAACVVLIVRGVVLVVCVRCVCVQCVCRVYAKVPRYAGVQGASVHHVQVCMCAGVQVRMC